MPNPTPSPAAPLAPTIPSPNAPQPSALSRLSLRDKLLLAQAVHEIGTTPPDWGKVSALLLTHPLIREQSRLEAAASAGLTLGRIFGTRECERAWIALMRQRGLVLSKEDGLDQGVQIKAKEARGAQPRMDRKAQLALAQLIYAERMEELREQIKEKETQFKSLINEIDDLKSGRADARLETELRIELEARANAPHTPGPSNLPPTLTPKAPRSNAKSRVRDNSGDGSTPAKAEKKEGRAKAKTPSAADRRSSQDQSAALEPAARKLASQPESTSGSAESSKNPSTNSTPNKADKSGASASTPATSEAAAKPATPLNRPVPPLTPPTPNLAAAAAAATLTKRLPETQTTPARTSTVAPQATPVSTTVKPIIPMTVTPLGQINSNASLIAKGVTPMPGVTPPVVASAKPATAPVSGASTPAPVAKPTVQASSAPGSPRIPTTTSTIASVPTTPFTPSGQQPTKAVLSTPPQSVASNTKIAPTGSQQGMPGSTVPTSAADQGRNPNTGSTPSTPAVPIPASKPPPAATAASISTAAVPSSVSSIFTPSRVTEVKVPMQVGTAAASKGSTNPTFQAAGPSGPISASTKGEGANDALVDNTPPSDGTVGASKRKREDKDPEAGEARGDERTATERKPLEGANIGVRSGEEEERSSKRARADGGDDGEAEKGGDGQGRTEADESTTGMEDVRSAYVKKEEASNGPSLRPVEREKEQDGLEGGREKEGDQGKERETELEKGSKEAREGREDGEKEKRKEKVEGEDKDEEMKGEEDGAPKAGVSTYRQDKVGGEGGGDGKERRRGVEEGAGTRGQEQEGEDDVVEMEVDHDGVTEKSLGTERERDERAEAEEEERREKEKERGEVEEKKEQKTAEDDAAAEASKKATQMEEDMDGDVDLNVDEEDEEEEEETEEQVQIIPSPAKRRSVRGKRGDQEDARPSTPPMERETERERDARDEEHADLSLSVDEDHHREEEEVEEEAAAGDKLSRPSIGKRSSTTRSDSNKGGSVRRSSSSNGRRKGRESSVHSSKDREEERPQQAANKRESAATDALTSQEREKAKRKNTQVLMMLLTEVSNHTHGNLFHNPIKEQDAPDYYSLIKRAVDIKTIKTRIKEGSIRSSTELRKALTQMFANSLIYNRPGSEVYRMANEMRVAADEIMDRYEQTQSYASSRR